MKKLAFTILVAVIGVLVTATVLEKVYGTTFVATNVYGAWWFIALWALLCVVSIVVLIRRKVYKRPAMMLIHCSFVLILLGAFVTHLYGLQGSVHLRVGEPTDMIVNRETGLIEHLPFSVTLKDFQLKTYPGTQSPMDYVSVISTSSSDELVVSMNNIGSCQHYRFYQSGYDPDLQGTYLSVSHDPWGIGITYTGYAMLFIGMLLFLLLPNEGYQRLVRSIKRKAVAIVVLSMMSLPAVAAEPRVLPADVAAEFGNLYAYYNGRVCPFQTVAVDFTTKIYGSPSYHGYTSEQILTGWMFFPTTWLDQPFIKVKGNKVHELLGSDAKYVSYDDFFVNGTYRLDETLMQIRSGADVDDARAVNEADEKMNLLLMLFGGQLTRIYPAGDKWYSQSDNLPDTLPHDQWFFIKHSLDYVGELAAKTDYKELSATIAKIRKYQQKTVDPDYLPSDLEFKAEQLYNTTNYIRPLAMVLLTVGILAFIAIEIVNRKSLNRILSRAFLLLAVATVCYLLYFISLRTIVSGHLPLANGYEVMMFMSLCSMLLTLCLWRRHTQIRSFGFIMAGLTMLVAMMGQSNPQITPLMPVLSSPLLSIHVCVIMMSYTLFAFITLQSIAWFITRKGSPQEVMLLLYPALFLLATGIFIGAIWANVSWGRYWGWDPKEVWALITLLIYSIPLHKGLWLKRPPLTPPVIPLWGTEGGQERIFPLRTPPKGREGGGIELRVKNGFKFKGEGLFYLYMILAFLSVIITYFGVNFFLGGMHSYANG